MTSWLLDFSSAFMVSANSARAVVTASFARAGGEITKLKDRQSNKKPITTEIGIFKKFFGGLCCITEV
jgi:hypothetical protein